MLEIVFCAALVAIFFILFGIAIKEKEKDPLTIFVSMAFGILFLTASYTICYRIGQDAVRTGESLSVNQIAAVRTSYPSADPKRDGATTFLVQALDSTVATNDRKVFEKELAPGVDPVSLTPGTQVIKIGDKVHIIKKPSSNGFK